MSKAFSIELRNLRALELYLTQSLDRFDSQIVEMFMQAIDQLRECTYLLRNVDTLEEDYKLRDLQSQVSVLISELEHVIQRKSGRSIRAKVLESIKKVHEEVSMLKSQENTMHKLREEIKDLASLVADYQKTIGEIELEKNKAIDQVRSAKVVGEWPDSYEEYIRNDFENQDTKSKRREATAWFNRLFYWGDNFCQLERKWAQRRFLWLLTLGLVFSVYLVWAVFFVQDKTNLNELVISKLSFLPLIAVLAIGFAFSSRNYRIYANLLAEYRHRKIVASILQNLILNESLKDNDNLKLEMLREGAKAMFNLKSVGHLAKENVEKLSIAEMLKEIRK